MMMTEDEHELTPLAALRDFRARLDDIAARHPRLVGGASTADEWETTLETVQTTLRLPPDLLARVDAYADVIRQRTGIQPSRTAAAAALLELALDCLDAADGDPVVVRERATR